MRFILVTLCLVLSLLGPGNLKIQADTTDQPAGVKDLLGVVPGNAVTVVYARSRSASLEQALVLLRQYSTVPKKVLRASSLVELIQEHTDITKGVDNEGILALMVPAWQPSNEKNIACYLPVGDYNLLVRELKATVEDGIATFTRADVQYHLMYQEPFAVLVVGEGKPLLKKLKKSKKPLASSLRISPGWLAQQDAGVILTKGGTHQLFQAVIDALQETRKPKKTESIEQIIFRWLVSGIAEDFARAIQTWHRNVDEVALGVGLRGKKHLQVSLRVTATKGQELASALEKVYPPRRDLLSGLPDRRFSVVLGIDTPGERWGELYRANILAMKPGFPLSSPQQKQRWKTIQQGYIQQVKQLSRVSFFATQEASAGSRGQMVFVDVWKVRDSNTFLKRSMTLAEQWNELTAHAPAPARGKKKQFNRVRTTKVGTFPVVMFQKSLARDKDVPIKSSDLTLCATPDKHTLIEVQAPTEKLARKWLLATVKKKKSLQENRQMQALVRLLSPRAHVVGVLDLAHFTPSVPPAIKDLGPKAQVGVAFLPDPVYVEMRVLAPLELIETTIQLVAREVNRKKK